MKRKLLAVRTWMQCNTETNTQHHLLAKKQVFDKSIATTHSFRLFSLKLLTPKICLPLSHFPNNSYVMWMTSKTHSPDDPFRFIGHLNNEDENKNAVRDLGRIWTVGYNSKWLPVVGCEELKVNLGGVLLETPLFTSG